MIDLPVAREPAPLSARSKPGSVRPPIASPPTVRKLRRDTRSQKPGEGPKNVNMTASFRRNSAGAALCFLVYRHFGTNQYPPMIRSSPFFAEIAQRALALSGLTDD